MAGRVQLATTGTQDMFFTDNPEYTHFIKNFRKHTNFAMYDREQELHGDVKYGNTLKCTIPADSGHLLQSVRVHVDLSALEQNGTHYKYVESIGHAIIEHVDLIIGGQLIQRIPRDWLHIHSEHYITQSKQTNLSKLVGKNPGENSGDTVSGTIDGYLGNATASRTYIVDIPFYFHNNPELSIPLRAFTKHECEIEIQLSNKELCIHDYVNITNRLYDPNETVYTVSAGSRYKISGSNETNPSRFLSGAGGPIEVPTLTLIRGNTYTFNQRDASNETHPLFISTTSDGTHTGGGVAYPVSHFTIPSPYEPGTVANDSFVFTVPLDAPDTLYYYCQKHNGMGGEINVRNQTFDSKKAVINSVELYTGMVHVDRTEQIKLETLKRDYIITQVQQNRFRIPVSSGDGNDTLKFRMNFSNPVKELYFVIARVNNNKVIHSVFNYDHPSQIYPVNGKYINYENLVDLELNLDKEVILDKVTGNLINLRAVQSGIHHSRTQLFRRFYSYSFALEPERWYPTGQRNFSTIKDQHVTLTLNNNTSDIRELRVYALSNNILRIQNGAGRLIFPNGPIGD